MRDHTLEPPCTEPKTAICTICHDAVPEDDFSPFAGVCCDCEGDYLNSRAKELAPEFIAAHETEFYLGWFNGLPEEERAVIVKSAYRWKRAFYEQNSKSLFAGMCEDEAEFCVEHRAFPDFVGATQ